MSIGINIFDNETTLLDYEATGELVNAMLSIGEVGPPISLAQAERITTVGQLMIRMMMTEPDQGYINDHYETVDNLAVARYFFFSTNNDLIKTYLMMRWNFSDS